MNRQLQASYFLPPSREATLNELSGAPFDLLIVGGGITGAGVARHAAGCGLRVALVEQGDFASGTSSRSSRLIHGGLRYLMHGQMQLVRRSLCEQQHLASIAPHLVRPLPVLLPLYGKSFSRRWAYRGGMQIYKRLRPSTMHNPHKTLSATQTQAREPLLPRVRGGAALQGGFAFHEYVTHDARLVWETILDAQIRGACAINYARLVNLLTSRGRIVGGEVEDVLTGRMIEVQARIIISTTGPWSDRFIAQCSSSQFASMARPRLRLTKGVHIVVPRRLMPLAHGVIFFSPRDRRPLIAIPSENMVIIGTTETAFDGNDDPGTVQIDSEDTNYLLEAAQNFFTTSSLTRKSIVAAWAGVRPLYDETARPVGEVSRAYAIKWQGENLLSVLGGKLTLHRRAAIDVLRAVLPKLNRASSQSGIAIHPLSGAVWSGSSPDETTQSLLKAGIEEDSVAHLISVYGSRSLLFTELVAENPAWRKRIVPVLPHIWAELAFAQRAEMAVHPQDFLARRTDLALRAKAETCALPLELETLWGELSERTDVVAYA